MNIQEMHTTFRTLGQQMGMQLIRGILPESIDVYLNEAINEKVRNIVIGNSTTSFNDRVAIQDNSISPVNSIRTLSKRSSLTIPIIAGNIDYHTIIITTQKVMFYTSFGVRYLNFKRRIGTRFIETDKLDDTRADYCNRESWDAPIVTMNINSSDQECIELYINNTAKTPDKLEISYIELPAIVKWHSTLSSATSCNLPIYIHNEIVELAVDKFFKSVGSTTKPVTRN